ncbi:hypothetical protein HAX54_014600 [Datura stramonium]|uniref:Uncharacterized protein n=1 Tax=Datura stramonium TaxID=4076 RepID=A0ABS8RYS5_DATST|nr:hypothetical protein [Datura stramonium]
MACDIVAPGLTDKYNVGESVHTSIGVHDSNESSSAVPPNCNGENDKENLSMEVCQIVACDVLPPGSMEKHTVGERVIYASINYEQDRNESNSITHNLVINKQKRGERTSCDDLIMAIEVLLNRLERQTASRRRCLDSI